MESSIAPAKAALKADRESLQAAHRQIETDLANGAEKSVLGSDVLAMDEARTKLKSDARALHDQVLAQLSPEQQQAFDACVAAHAQHGMGIGHQPPPQ
jgi:hypothetical protein